MKLVPLSRKDGSIIGNVDEHTSLAVIQENCPVFFQTPHGKRETFSMHRGQLIVRNTVKFHDSKPQRKTSIYLYFVDGAMANDTFCVMKDVDSLPQARQLIDSILDVTRCAY